MNAAVGFLLLCIVLLGAVTCRAEEAGSAGGTITGHRPAGAILAQAPPRYYDEQLLNYRLTEFCATVKRPPKSLIEAIDNAFSTPEGKQSAAVIDGFNYIHILDRLVQERCGDA
jgi:hypothetical protein